MHLCSVIHKIKDRKRLPALVLFFVTLLSLLNAIGFSKHVYAMSEVKRILDCPYAANGASPVSHMHNADCYDQKGKLICLLSERSQHIHTDNCRTETTLLICGIEEQDGHQHTNDCYCYTEVKICTLEESIGHQHDESCYEHILICDEDDHAHSESCWVARLICGIEEGAGAHTHTDMCYRKDCTLICEIPEGADSHVHTQECYKTEYVLNCGLETLPIHIHGENCFRLIPLPVEEQEWNYSDVLLADNERTADNNEECHNREVEKKKEELEDDMALPARPQSEPTADLETSQIWEKCFEKLQLSGNWAIDLIAIAETQFGYSESSRNFDAVFNDKKETYDLKGWTRYGAWYGYPYGDWCAMFISFCLYYAKIPYNSFPYDCATTSWVRNLREREMYLDAEDYAPTMGDLVFFDWEGDGLADHVGIVYAVDKNSNYLQTIEGNHTSAVQTFDYSLDNCRIMGYGLLPENPDNREEVPASDVMLTEEKQLASELRYTDIKEDDFIESFSLDEAQVPNSQIAFESSFIDNYTFTNDVDLNTQVSVTVTDSKTSESMTTMTLAAYEHTMIYDPNGGTWADGSKEMKTEFYSGSSFGGIETEPVRNGYEFVEWAHSNIQNNNHSIEGSENTYADTLTAQWRVAGNAHALKAYSREFHSDYTFAYWIVVSFLSAMIVITGLILLHHIQKGRKKP